MLPPIQLALLLLYINQELLINKLVDWLLKVGKRAKSKEASYAVENVNQISQVIPEIWGTKTDGDDQRITRSKSELESIIATTAAVGA